MKTIRRCGTTIAASFTLALCLAAPALGAVHTWIGPAGGLWSNAGNWSGGNKPTSGEPGGTVVEFGSNTSSVMDIAGLTIAALEFTGSNNTIGGTTTLTINASISTDNVISDGQGNTLASSLPITISTANLYVVSKAGTLTLAGAIGGNEGLKVIGEGGNLAMNGTDTYTGPTSIESGVLHIATTVGDVIAGSSLQVGLVAGKSAELVLDQDNDISAETEVTVSHEGTIDFQSFIDNAKSLTIFGGRVLNAAMRVTNAVTMSEGSTVTLTGPSTAGSLSMSGGSISGTGLLELSGNLQATSAPTGPATISAPLELNATPTVTVNPGTPPELKIAGPITQTGGTRGITKAGTGTLLLDGTNTYTGPTTVSAGTLQLAGATQTGPFTIEQNGTLAGSGTVGATTIAGTLIPAAPGLNTGALSFGATGRLDDTIAAATQGTIPSVLATGAVAIDPSAVLNLALSHGIALPHGTSVALLGNDGSDAIEGHFDGTPDNDVLSTLEGVPLAVSYEGGDGNDLALTAGNVPPQVGSIDASSSSLEAGRPLALSLNATDANQDPLTTTWNFGDGTTAAGPSISHAYAKAGSYTIIATVSDGLAQAQSTTVVTVTPVSRGDAPSTATVHASAYGTQFNVTAPNVCVRPGAAFTIALGVKKPTATHQKRKVLNQVTKVRFTLNGKRAKTVRSAPYRVKLTLPHGAKSGARSRVQVTASLKLRGGRHRTKTLTVSVESC
jgi:autotransporter-associated beta strand protein